MLITQIDDEYSYSLLKEIDIATKRATEMISKLRSISGKSNFEKSKLDINLLIHEISEMVVRTLSSNLSINLELNALWSIVVGDQIELSNMILNLILNARDAMPNGGTIILRTNNIFLDDETINKKQLNTIPGVQVMISVIDNGVGMNEVVKEKAFDPYFTTKSDLGDRGLGLSIVYNTVLNHNGFIEFESEINLGTKFFISLPYVGESVNLQYKKLKTETPIKIFKKNRKILNVDDDQMVCVFIEFILRKKGYSTIAINDPREALQHYTKNNKDIELVLLDLNMPRLNGWETLKKMKKVNNEVLTFIIS